MHTQTHRKIAVVIPAHNEEAYLGRLLDSLNAQTRQADKIVVVCDSCTDGTEEVALRKGAFTLRTTTKNASANRNLGIQAAPADVYVVLDADTYASPGFLSAVEHLVAAGYDYGGATLISDNLHAGLWEKFVLDLRLAYINREQRKRGTIVGTGLFFTHRCWLEVKGYDADWGWGDDVEICHRFARIGSKHGIAATEHLLYSHRRFFGRPIRENLWRIFRGLQSLCKMYLLTPQRGNAPRF